MTVLTKQKSLTSGVWVEVTSDLGMADGKSYAVEVIGGNGEAVDVMGTNAPASTVVGHPWFCGGPNRPADYRTFPKKAGQTWWWRASGSGASVIATEI